MRKTRLKTYKTLKGLCSQLKRTEIDGDTMANKRGYFKDGWHYNFRISEEAENEFWTGLAHIVWKSPTDAQIRNLRKVDYWMLNRLTWHPRYGFSYCSGQDYPSEIRMIRKCANKF